MKDSPRTSRYLSTAVRGKTSKIKQAEGETERKRINHHSKHSLRALPQAQEAAMEKQKHTLPVRELTVPAGAWAVLAPTRQVTLRHSSKFRMYMRYRCTHEPNTYSHRNKSKNIKLKRNDQKEKQALVTEVLF